ncbi:MAG: EscU/YscU/HrcU family type III secretion system export apparatus switch protein [Mariprofundaceae bacterium]
MHKKPQNKPQVVALRWNPEEEMVPRLSAKGSGDVANRILEIAKKNNIPIREDKDLVQILSWLEIGEDVQPQVYTAVAEILTFIYWVSKRYESELSGS